PGPAGRLQVPRTAAHRGGHPSDGHGQGPAPERGRPLLPRLHLGVRFVVAGAGAVGGYLGARLALAGGDVTLLARGPHLAALRDQGVRVTSPDGDFDARPAVASDPEAIGPADVVVLGVKAHSLPGLAPRLGPLLPSDPV